jgi:hypothetical protein
MEIIKRLDLEILLKDRVGIWSVEEEDNLRSIATDEWRSVLSTGIYRQISHEKRASEPRFLYGGKFGGKPDL